MYIKFRIPKFLLLYKFKIKKKKKKKKKNRKNYILLYNFMV